MSGAIRAGFDFAAVTPAFRAVAGFEARPLLPRPIRFLVGLQIRATAGEAYIQGLNQRDALITRMEQFLSDWDALALPGRGGPGLHPPQAGRAD